MVCKAVRRIHSCVSMYSHCLWSVHHALLVPSFLHMLHLVTASSCNSFALTCATCVCRASTLLARSNCCQHDHGFLLKDNEDQSNLQFAGGSEQSDASNVTCIICVRKHCQSVCLHQRCAAAQSRICIQAQGCFTCDKFWYDVK